MNVVEFIEARLADRPEDLSQKATGRVRDVVSKHKKSGLCIHCVGGNVNKCVVLDALAWLWDDHKDYGSWK